MKAKQPLAVLAAASLLLASAAIARDGARWWDGRRIEPHWGGPCELKLESKPGEYKREIKCKDGVGADWGRPRKRELNDGGCKAKIEATREEYKEEVKCEGHSH